MKRPLLSIVCLFSILGITNHHANGQTVVVKKRNVETGEVYGVSGSKSSTTSNYNQAIKYNFLPFFIGEMPLGYELKLNEYLTAEAGLGITTNNALDELLYVYDDFYALADRNLANLSHYASFKVFPEGNAFNDGYYLGFNYNYRPYSKGFNVNQSTVRATKRFTDIGLVFGFEGRPSDQIMLDVYAGVSQRHINWDVPSISQIIDPLTGDVVTQVQINNTRYPTLGGLLGFKLSYLFGNDSGANADPKSSTTTKKRKTRRRRSRRRRR